MAPSATGLVGVHGFDWPLFVETWVFENRHFALKLERAKSSAAATYKTVVVVGIGQ
jgi:hypothetical protein